MKHLLLFLLSAACILSHAQELKPCGTSVLSRRHLGGEKASSRARLMKAPQKDAFLGEKRGLIILVEFPNSRFQSEDALQTWTDIANLEGYSDNNATGSVGDYFHDQSYGKFQLTFDVVGPVEAKHDYAYYGKNKDWGSPTGWFDQNVGELVEEACLGVADQVRFSDYDWNDDGEVDQVFLLYAGHGENDYYYRDSTVIWPHMAILSEDWEGYENGLLLQGMRINTYACSNEINRSDRLAGMGTICHEFSHCLGLPDLYDTERGTSVLGRYDLMDQGCYNGDSWCPIGYSSYERYACGWLTPKAVTDISAPLLLALHKFPDALIYRNAPDAQDYYLIEYRDKKKWDTYWPTAGLTAWYIDYDEQAWKDNTVNNDPNHRRVERLAVDQIPVAIHSPSLSSPSPSPQPVIYYDLQGNRLPGKPSSTGLYLVKLPDGSVRKITR